MTLTAIRESCLKMAEGDAQPEQFTSHHRLVALLDRWPSVRTSPDEIDHRDFFDLLEELVLERRGEP